jgi:hypothetical protein
MVELTISLHDLRFVDVNHLHLHLHLHLYLNRLEAVLGEEERARGIYELAVTQPLLDMPEVLWKKCVGCARAMCMGYSAWFCVVLHCLPPPRTVASYHLREALIPLWVWRHN